MPTKKESAIKSSESDSKPVRIFLEMANKFSIRDSEPSTLRFMSSSILALFLSFSLSSNCLHSFLVLTSVHAPIAYKKYESILSRHSEFRPFSLSKNLSASLTYLFFSSEDFAANAS